ncbi:protein transporter tim10 [Coelomomyces lativittatus]|nr:protein transporter tim10 [Coelomomyces lativittatus]KAJ1507184.1 protein transporter tim10 [Coelomomyces lativittatus]KAJ1511985.1 protein transporter tim10 [Coelomomyces lativittatus]
MSFFQKSPSTSAESSQNLAMAENEIDMMTDNFNIILKRCHSKCISEKYHESELTKGESLCIDRCVSKYFEVSLKVGKKLAERGQKNTAATIT